MNGRFLITVIVPVYNVQDYLDECFACILNQTIGFSNIQLILINDGSSDESGAVCLSFAEKHPHNVIYIEQENSGVSSARNQGIKLADGVLTTFLDADDKWSSDAFELAYKAHLQYPETAVLSCRMCFFDSMSGDHQLNYKYETDRLVDISHDYNVPQLSSSSVFIKTEVVKNYKYLEGQKYSEDFRFINEILLDHFNMLLLEKPVYWYRKRASDSSAMQRSLEDSDYYIKTCRDVYQYLFEICRRKHGYVLRYLQFCVMYDLRWRLKVPLDNSRLSESQKAEYVNIIKSLLLEIDDDIILKQKRIALALQLYALDLKYNEPATDALRADSAGIISYKDHPVFDLSHQTIMYLDSAFVQAGNLIIEGQVNLPFSADLFRLSYSVNGIQKDISLHKNDSNIKTYLNGVLKSNLAFKIAEDLSGAYESEITMFVRFDNQEYVIKPKFRTSTSLDKKRCFLRFGRIFLYRTDRSLVATPFSIGRFFSHLFRS